MIRGKPRISYGENHGKNTRKTTGKYGRNHVDLLLFILHLSDVIAIGFYFKKRL
jgi:hypothetical protein